MCYAKMRSAQNTTLGFACSYHLKNGLEYWYCQSSCQNSKKAKQFQHDSRPFATTWHVMIRCRVALQWCHHERDGVSIHRRLDCLFNRLFKRRSKKTSKLRLTGLFEMNPSVTSWFPSQRASNAENVSIWWRHHGMLNQLHTLGISWYTMKLSL